jgi:hypothetical protein
MTARLPRTPRDGHALRRHAGIAERGLDRFGDGFGITGGDEERVHSIMGELARAADVEGTIDGSISRPASSGRASRKRR